MSKIDFVDILDFLTLRGVKVKLEARDCSFPSPLSSVLVIMEKSYELMIFLNDLLTLGEKQRLPEIFFIRLSAVTEFRGTVAESGI